MKDDFLNAFDKFFALSLLVCGFLFVLALGTQHLNAVTIDNPIWWIAGIVPLVIWMMIGKVLNKEVERSIFHLANIWGGSLLLFFVTHIIPAGDIFDAMLAEKMSMKSHILNNIILSSIISSSLYVFLALATYNLWLIATKRDAVEFNTMIAIFIWNSVFLSMIIAI